MYEKEIEYIRTLFDEAEYGTKEYKMLYNIKEALEKLESISDEVNYKNYQIN